MEIAFKILVTLIAWYFFLTATLIFWKNPIDFSALWRSWNPYTKIKDAVENNVPVKDISSIYQNGLKVANVVGKVDVDGLAYKFYEIDNSNKLDLDKSFQYQDSTLQCAARGLRVGFEVNLGSNPRSGVVYNLICRKVK